MMDFKFEIGAIVYGCVGDGVQEYKVAERTCQENDKGVSITYQVYDPSNWSRSSSYEESHLYSDKEVAIQVLIDKENERHRQRIEELNAAQ